ncbi:inner membrane protein PLUS sensory box protein LssE (plasmid) [Legionella adelaidensis]|uniref:Inner membrane protein PLUS sensory box protein LssE n=1 Tax=Legionella adelaidensis TaxID=45056 RepID=A0A0W0R5M2_9GAMM|nr:EAL domain-containing protein [Legionella adelaidensis]KTC66316.1 inner membrane protein/sensory box protein LssE [Legionella adelaidensis]VEH84912.1 inner membrane protein PLUS sensory box protein LssE [Legionella adelaidensis]
MRLEWKFFQSKVAHRIFYLFILSALIPIIFLAIFLVLQLNRQLTFNSQVQVRQDVKNAGMAVIGRLSNLDKQLNLLGKALIFINGKDFIKSTENLEDLATDFKALSIIAKNGKALSLHGPALFLPPNLPTSPGDSSLSIVREETSKTNRFFITHKMNKEVFLVGEINQDLLWDFNLTNQSLLWVLDTNNNVIYSTSVSPIPSPFLVEKLKSDTGVFSWKLQNKEFIGAYWSLFLRFRFHSTNWVIILAEPESNLFSQIKNLYKILLPTIFFAFLVSMLLSQSQIRRYLIPLEQLRNATRRIASRDFSTPVTVKSGDEFEELGDAFNRMAKHLRQQFRTLSLLSVLDQSILKNEDGEKVLNLIFASLKELVDYDLLILGSFKRNNKIDLRVLTGENSNEILKVVEIKKEEYKNLQYSREITLNLNVVDAPAYLSFVKEYGIRYLIIFPILHKNDPAAMIVLGFNHIDSLNDCNTEELHDIFYRAAVAFTHAEWEERLYYQAHYDDLTGLPNRLVLRDQLHRALIRNVEARHHCVLMFLDLDNFKDINDTLGHSVGDNFLYSVAQTMQNAIGHNGLIARIGGDEFTILLTDIPRADLAHKKAISAADKLLKVFAKPYNVKGAEFHVTASIGIVIAPEDSNNSDEIIKFADMSMYKAKESGKNRYVFFSSALEKIVRERNRMLQELYTALTEEQFRIYFQPKINCENFSLVGAEVLLRWEHPTLGLLLPDYFLPLTEESNLIIPLGEWVIHEACRQVKEWEKQNLSVPPIAINIAAKQFTQENLVSQITKIIETTQVNPQNLEFEITESSLIGNLSETISILNQIHHLGSRISIDDFGTGYSSMRYLQMLPLDNMKIDRVFIQGLPGDKRNLSIIKAIVNLAKNTGLVLIAEGIETKMQSELLHELDCVIQQGFYFSEPLPAKLFAKRYLKPLSS